LFRPKFVENILKIETWEIGRILPNFGKINGTEHHCAMYIDLHQQDNEEMFLSLPPKTKTKRRVLKTQLRYFDMHDGSNPLAPTVSYMRLSTENPSYPLKSKFKYLKF
jgi:hypothetical protein